MYAHTHPPLHTRAPPFRSLFYFFSVAFKLKPLWLFRFLPFWFLVILPIK